MTEVLSRKQAWLFAAAVVIGLLLFAFGLFSIGDKQQLWNGTFNITMKVGNAAGLEPGTRVRIQGVPAGQVASIEQPVQRGGDLLVTLKLDGRCRALLGQDARAEIKPEGLLGGKVIDIFPGSPGSETLAEHAIIPGREDSLADDLKKLASESHQTLEDVRKLSEHMKSLSVRSEKAVKEIEGLTSDLREGKGVLGQEVLSTIKQVRDTSQSVQFGFDAMKQLPLVGKHVDPNTKLLVRPGMDKVVGVFTEAELFHEGRSVFHPEGVEQLRAWAAKTLPGTKLSGSEVVIVSYTDPNYPDQRAAEILTQEQAEAIRTYLTDHHGIHKTGTFSRRTVHAIGMGTRVAPGMTASPSTPLRRIEIIIFAPAGTLS
ncbi:MAG: MCE family protein [Planctomycetia bacterium]|nr:MCE family protein [Planctomycetia bacterium]